MSKTKPADEPLPNGIDRQLDQCFIITPIGDINSDIYNKAMGLIDAVIKPVLEEFNFKPVAANHMSAPGSINRQLLKAILEDKLVIANLTGLNPNVMYELAVRHAARLPVVIMTEKGTRLPFDITDQRTIFYEDSLSGLSSAKAQLHEMISVALKEENPDNPIYQAMEQASIFKQLSPTNPLKVILERLSLIEDNTNQMKIQNSIIDLEDLGPSDRSNSRRVKVTFAEEFHEDKGKDRIDYLVSLVLTRCSGISLKTIRPNKLDLEVLYFNDGLNSDRNFFKVLKEDKNIVGVERLY